MKTKKYKYIVAVAVVWVLMIAAVAIGYYADMIPRQIETDKMLSGRQKNYERIVSVQKMEIPANRAFRQEQQVKYEDVVNDFTIAESDQNALIFKISQIANGIGLKEFSTTTRDKGQLSTTEKSKLIQEAFLTIEFRSTCNQFTEFVNQLEYTTPFVFIESIRIRRNNEDLSQNTIVMDVSYLIRKPEVPKKNKV